MSATPACVAPTLSASTYLGGTHVSATLAMSGAARHVQVRIVPHIISHQPYLVYV